MRGRSIGVDVTVDDKVINISIPPNGYRAENEAIEKALLKHPLKGLAIGFEHVENIKELERVNPTFNGEPTKTEKVINTKRQNQAEKVVIIDAEEEAEPKTKAKPKAEAEPESKEPVKSEEVTDTNEDGAITVEDVKNINQAKDYLRDNFEDVDGRSIGSKEKILAVAKEKNVEFPNLK